MTRARIEVDHSARAAYIDLGTESRGVASTVEVSPTINVDLDEFGMAVGVELLSLSLRSLPLADLWAKCHFRDEHAALIEENLPAILELLAGGQVSSATQGETSSVGGFQLA
ncbi:DUF2283 domain-containing protein [Mycolicibacterium elephantis]|uniref:DUF2283 domain-containing protein n=1 Tax=Mycolicibacterium elephantis TaxID=81858 RepID=UPI0009EED651|nr:DUF2283 domain-containing protein [Mycolicibacterium elephantis]